jgi:hypothetical protein
MTGQFRPEKAKKQRRKRSLPIASFHSKADELTIRLSISTRRVVTRFEAERQAVALMELVRGYKIYSIL